jgi:hypothetical protein
MTGATLVRVYPRTLELEAAAHEAGLHPDLVLRFVRIGLIEPRGGTPEAPLLPLDTPALLARAVRLRRDLGLDYGGAVFACRLLDRIEQLEARLRNYGEVTAWNSTT